MRNLDECRAEIFRLGENKIKERKKRRNTMLLACIPVCLCVIATAAFMAYGGKVNIPDGDVHYDVVLKGEMAEGTLPVEYLQVEIKSFGIEPVFYCRVNEQQQINEVFAAVEGFYSQNSDDTTNGTTSNDALGNPNYSGGSPDYNNGNPITLPTIESQQRGYLISFTTEHGDIVEYKIIGNVLKNETTGKTVRLTNAQKRQLLSELIGGA